MLTLVNQSGPPLGHHTIAFNEIETSKKTQCIIVHSRWGNAVRHTRSLSRTLQAIVEVADVIYNVVCSHLPYEVHNTASQRNYHDHLDYLSECLATQSWRQRQAVPIVFMDANTSLALPFSGSGTGPHIHDKAATWSHRALSLVGTLQLHHIMLVNTMDNMLGQIGHTKIKVRVGIFNWTLLGYNKIAIQEHGMSCLIMTIFRCQFGSACRLRGSSQPECRVHARGGGLGTPLRWQPCRTGSVPVRRARTCRAYKTRYAKRVGPPLRRRPAESGSCLMWTPTR